MDGLPSDRRILHIAAEAAEANDKNVPLIFLGLKGNSVCFLIIGMVDYVYLLVKICSLYQNTINYSCYQLIAVQLIFNPFDKNS